MNETSGQKDAMKTQDRTHEPSVMTLHLSKKLKSAADKGLPPASVVQSVLNDQLNKGKWRWMRPRQARRPAAGPTHHSQQMKIEINLKGTKLEAATGCAQVKARVIDFRINEQNKTISANLASERADGCSSSSSEDDRPAQRKVALQERRVAVHPLLQQAEQLHGRDTGEASKKSAAQLGTEQSTSHGTGIAKLPSKMSRQASTMLGQRPRQESQKLLDSKTIKRLNNFQDKKTPNPLVPISKLRSQTHKRNDMFSERMEKIEQNMITMFDKLLEPQGHDVNLSIQKTTQSILQNRFQYKSAKITDLKFVNQNDIRQLLEADQAQKTFAFNQYLNQMKQQRQESNQELREATSTKNALTVHDLDGRSKALANRAKRISRLSQDSQVSSLLKNNMSMVRSQGSHGAAAEADAKGGHQLGGRGHQVANLDDATPRGSLVRMKENVKVHDIIDLQAGNVRSQMQRGGSSLPGEKCDPNQEAAIGGGGDPQIFTAQYHVGGHSAFLGTPGSREREKRVDREGGALLEAASPSGQVIVIEKEFGGLDFVQKPRTQALRGLLPAKSQSGEQNSTDINQSNALSDHLTTQLVPMSIHDVQNCDGEMDVLEVGAAPAQVLRNAQVVKDRDRSGEAQARREKDRQSRYLLRNQRMRLFSPVTKAKYQHEVLLRQSEPADIGAKNCGASVENEEELPTMLRVLRAVSPTEEDNDHRKPKTRGGQALGRGRMTQGQKSQQIVQMNVNLKLQGTLANATSQTGANIMINGVACKPLSGGASTAQRPRYGVLSFRNDFGSLKESQELRQSRDDASWSPSRRRRAPKVEPSVQDSKVFSSHKRDVVPRSGQRALLDGNQILFADDEAALASRESGNPKLSSAEPPADIQLPYDGTDERAMQHDAGRGRNAEVAGQMQGVLSGSTAPNQQQQHETLHATNTRNQCTSISPASRSTPLRAMDIRESNPTDAGLSPGLLDDQERLDSKLVTTAKLNSPNPGNDAYRASATSNQEPRPVLVAAHLTRSGYHPRASEASVSNGPRQVLNTNSKLARPIFSKSGLHGAAASKIEGAGMPKQNQQASLDLERRIRSDSQRGERRVSAHEDGMAVEELVDTGRHTATLGQELAEIVKSRDGSQHQNAGRIDRKNLEEIVMSSLKEHPLAAELEENQRSAMEAYQGIEQVGGKRHSSVTKKAGAGSASYSPGSAADMALREACRPLAATGLPATNEVGGYSHVLDQQSALDATSTILKKRSLAEVDNEYGGAASGKGLRQKVGVQRLKQDPAAHAKKAVERHGTNNSYSGNSATNSHDSFNYRIKAIGGNQALNIFNFDQQKEAQQHQTEKLKGDAPLSGPAPQQPSNNVNQPNTKAVGVECGANKKRTTFEPAVWTEVRQDQGSLSHSRNPIPERRPANLQSVKESMSQFAGVDEAKTISVDRPASNGWASQARSRAATPLENGARRHSHIQSPLQMWKEMNEQNWLRIKQDGYVPIPLKSTKSAHLKGTQSSQMSKIRPVLTNEQLTLLAHKKQALPLPSEAFQMAYQAKSMSAAEQFRKRKRGTNHRFNGHHSSAAAGHPTQLVHATATPASREEKMRTIDGTGSVKLSFIAQELQNFPIHRGRRQIPTTIDLYTSKTVHRRLPGAFQEGVAQSTAITIHPLSTTANMGANNALGSCNESGKVLQLGQQPGSKAMSAGADVASRAVDTETSHRPPLQMAAARNVKSQQAYRPFRRTLQFKQFVTNRGSRNNLNPQKFLSLQTLGPTAHPNQAADQDGQVKVVSLLRSMSPKSEAAEGRVKPQLQKDKNETLALRTDDPDPADGVISRLESRTMEPVHGVSDLSNHKKTLPLPTSGRSNQKGTSGILKKTAEMQQMRGPREQMAVVYQGSPADGVDGLDYESLKLEMTPQAADDRSRVSHMINDKRPSFPHHNTMADRGISDSLSRLHTIDDANYTGSKSKGAESVPSNRRQAPKQRGGPKCVQLKEAYGLTNPKVSSERSRFQRRAQPKIIFNITSSKVHKASKARTLANGPGDLQVSGQLIQNTASGKRSSVITLENQIKMMKDSLRDQAAANAQPDLEQHRAIERQQKLVYEIQRKRSQQRADAKAASGAAQVGDHLVLPAREDRAEARPIPGEGPGLASRRIKIDDFVVGHGNRDGMASIITQTQAEDQELG